jgi:hypothetical protein
VDWLSFPRRVLMLRFPSESATWVTDTAIIRPDTTNPIRITDTTDPIHTIATITGLNITGTTGIGFITTAITVIIITTAIGIKYY